MTGEAVLLALKQQREERQSGVELAARALVLQAYEQKEKRRDDWIKAGGAVMFRPVEAQGALYTVCDLLDRDGYRVAFGVSEQGSSDAEANALQNLINNNNQTEIEE